MSEKASSKQHDRINTKGNNCAKVKVNLLHELSTLIMKFLEIKLVAKNFKLYRRPNFTLRQNTIKVTSWSLIETAKVHKHLELFCALAPHLRSPAYYDLWKKPLCVITARIVLNIGDRLDKIIQFSHHFFNSIKICVDRRNIWCRHCMGFFE